MDDVEREAVGRAGRDAEAAGELRFLQRCHALPRGVAGVAHRVGVVQEQRVEAVGADAFERFLGGHAEVAGVLVGLAEPRVGEAQEALRAVAFAGINVVANDADEAIAVAGNSLQRAAQHRVRLAVAVNVRRHECADALVVGVADASEVAFLAESLAEVHVAAPAPSAVGSACQFHKVSRSAFIATARRRLKFARRNCLPRMDANARRKAERELAPSGRGLTRRPSRSVHLA